MLGLEGFVLLDGSSAYGELEQVIETTAAAAWCHGCGGLARPHGRRRTLVRNLLPAGGPVAATRLRLADCVSRTGCRSGEHRPGAQS